MRDYAALNTVRIRRFFFGITTELLIYLEKITYKNFFFVMTKFSNAFVKRQSCLFILVD